MRQAGQGRGVLRALAVGTLGTVTRTHSSLPAPGWREREFPASDRPSPGPREGLIAPPARSHLPRRKSDFLCGEADRDSWPARPQWIRGPFLFLSGRRHRSSGGHRIALGVGRVSRALPASARGAARPVLSTQSRSTVDSDTPKANATSGIDIPAKKRSSTTRASRGSNSSSLSSATSSSKRSIESSTASTRESRADRAPSPPRFAARRRRAWSTRMRRMACAAMAKKWPRLCQATRSWPTRRKYASCTSAVVCRVWPGRSRRRW